MLQVKHRSLYAAFDRFPSAKGAAQHIDRFARSLFEYADGGLLYVLGDSVLPAYQREGNVEIVRFHEPIANFLARTVKFSETLDRLMHQEAVVKTLRIAHFRDPWSGVPILAARNCGGALDSGVRDFAVIYEVNGLPSIELTHRYPTISADTLNKVIALEAFCLKNADRIVVPSETIRQAICARYGAVANDAPDRTATNASAITTKIVVIPNGADPPPNTPPRPVEMEGRYLIYFGATQVWQGIETLLRAFARLRDLHDLSLVVCASNDMRQLAGYKRLAEALEIGSRVRWMCELPQTELASWIAHAEVSLAPLTDCARNTQQGCAPLKILESMAHGIPVVASDLPCIRELLEDGRTGRLVHPDRPAELARAVRVLLQYPDQMRRLGQNARDEIANRLTWTHSTSKLLDVYRSLSIMGSIA